MRHLLIPLTITLVASTSVYAQTTNQNNYLDQLRDSMTASPSGAGITPPNMTDFLNGNSLGTKPADPGGSMTPPAASGTSSGTSSGGTTPPTGTSSGTSSGGTTPPTGTSSGTSSGGTTPPTGTSSGTSSGGSTLPPPSTSSSSGGSTPGNLSEFRRKLREILKKRFSSQTPSQTTPKERLTKLRELLKELRGILSQLRQQPATSNAPSTIAHYNTIGNRLASYDATSMNDAVGHVQADGLYGSLDIMSAAGIRGRDGEEYLNEVINNDSQTLSGAVTKALEVLKSKHSQARSQQQRQRIAQAIANIEKLLKNKTLQSVGRSLVSPFTDPRTGHLQKMDGSNLQYNASSISQMVVEFDKLEKEVEAGSASNIPAPSTRAARQAEKFLCNAIEGDCK